MARNLGRKRGKLRTSFIEDDVRPRLTRDVEQSLRIRRLIVDAGRQLVVEAATGDEPAQREVALAARTGGIITRLVHVYWPRVRDDRKGSMTEGQIVKARQMRGEE